MRLIETPGAQLTPIAPGVSRVQGFFPNSVVALQTDRHGGVSVGDYESFNLGEHVGDDPAAVAANRKRLMQICLGQGARPNDRVWLNQVHGTRIFSDSLPSSDCRADAKTASTPGEICAVMTADCLPLLIARPMTSQIAAVHAGWRGLCDGVIEATLNAMLQASPSANANGQGSAGEVFQDEWLIWLGPAIGPQSFDVGAEVRQAFMDQSPAAASGFLAIPDEPGKWRADLGALARHRIKAWPGDFVARIAQQEDCVMKNAAQYFSYRRCNKNKRPTGRMASLIFLLAG